MTRRRQAATGGGAVRSGFTLVEMLVVLVLVSLLGTLVIQGTGFFLGQYATVKRSHRESSLATLQQHWFGSTVAAMVPSRLAARRFAGDDHSFEGVTLQPLAAKAGRPVRVRWSIDAGSVLYTERGAQPWTVLSGHDRTLGFQFADSSREWHEAWPPNGSVEYIPRMVRLRSSDGRVLWLARFDLFPEPVPNYREEF